jgi:tripeptidyl-peptidase I
VITSGGGFSTYFGVPSWQNKSVEYYFSHLTPSEEPKPGYNPQGRGIPDISLIGVDYQVVVGGFVQTLFGTSCTSPVLAAFVSLVNSKRITEGKSSIGWINPTLYAVGYNNTVGIGNIFGASFNDVRSGNNSCCANGNPALAVCCSSGFQATNGWDPTTGWGSVNYTQFELIFDGSKSNSVSMGHPSYSVKIDVSEA